LHDAEILKNQLGRSLKNLESSAWTSTTFTIGNAALRSFEEDFLNRVAKHSLFSNQPWRPVKFNITGWPREWVPAGCPRSGLMQLRDFARSRRKCRWPHRFRFVQVPFNLGMTEALTLGNQSLRGHHRRSWSGKRTGYFADC